MYCESLNAMFKLHRETLFTVSSRMVSFIAETVDSVEQFNIKF